MSWDAYCNDSLLGTGHISQAVIVDNNNGEVKGSSSGFSLGDGEFDKLKELYKSPSHAFSHGVTIAGTKYQTIKADEQSIYGQKGTAGVITTQTEKLLVIGLYNEGTQPAEAASSVEMLADYLRGNGY